MCVCVCVCACCPCVQTQLQAAATENSESELSLHTELRTLRALLDDTKRTLSRLWQETLETSHRLDEVQRERDALTHTATQLEERGRQQDRVLEKLKNEVRGNLTDHFTHLKPLFIIGPQS